jgi:hypothetical protein
MRSMVALAISKLMRNRVLKLNVCLQSIRVAINSVGQTTLNEVCPAVNQLLVKRETVGLFKGIRHE